MPRYIIERQYLLPVYQHLAVEAPDLEAVCREALDDGEHDWEDAQEDYESSRPATIVAAVEITREEEWAIATKSQYERSGLMYEGRHELIEIPREFTEKDRQAELAEILERNDCGKAHVLLDGDDLERLKSIARMRVDR
jgi:threonine synthase